MDDADSLEALQSMFPDYSTDALREVLHVAAGDVQAATNFLLADGDDGGPFGAAAAEDGDEEDGDGEGSDEAEEDAADGGDDEYENEGVSQVADTRTVKRLRTVEPTPAAKLEGQKSNLVKFDEIVLRKTYLVRADQHLQLLSPWPTCGGQLKG
jgi:cobalamin biosynthesis protein CobT